MPVEGPRPRRRCVRALRRVGTAVVVLLAAWGAVDLLVPGSARVGAFRSADARQAYLAAYEDALATLPTPSRRLDLPTRYGTVRALEWSTAATADDVPALFLPGRASGAPMWGEQVRDLAGHRRLVLVDALGDAGLSQQTVPLASMADQAAWIDDVIAALSPGPVHLVGHSFGGATAAAYAVTHPERVATLTLLEPVFTFAGPPLATYWWATVLSLPLPQAWRDAAVRAIGGVDDIDRDDPLTRMIDLAASGFSAALPTPAVLSEEQLTALRMPTYVAVASDSSLAGGRGAVDRARRLPDVTIDIWPHTTHSLPMQVSADLDARLASFWAAHDA